MEYEVIVAKARGAAAASGVGRIVGGRGVGGEGGGGSVSVVDGRAVAPAGARGNGTPPSPLLVEAVAAFCRTAMRSVCASIVLMLTPPHWP